MVLTFHEWSWPGLYSLTVITRATFGVHERAMAHFPLMRGSWPRQRLRFLNESWGMAMQRAIRDINLVGMIDDNSNDQIKQGERVLWDTLGAFYSLVNHIRFTRRRFSLVLVQGTPTKLTLDWKKNLPGYFRRLLQLDIWFPPTPGSLII